MSSFLISSFLQLFALDRSVVYTFVPPPSLWQKSTVGGDHELGGKETEEEAKEADAGEDECRRCACMCLGSSGFEQLRPRKGGAKTQQSTALAHRFIDRCAFCASLLRQDGA